MVDLGVDVSPEKFLEAVRDHKPKVVGLSALLTTTMPAMKTTIEALKEAGTGLGQDHDRWGACDPALCR